MLNNDVLLAELTCIFFLIIIINNINTSVLCKIIFWHCSKCSEIIYGRISMRLIIRLALAFVRLRLSSSNKKSLRWWWLMSNIIICMYSIYVVSQGSLYDVIVWITSVSICMSWTHLIFKELLVNFSIRNHAGLRHANASPLQTLALDWCHLLHRKQRKPFCLLPTKI